MPPFDMKGLMGVALPQEEDEADVAPGDDGAGDATSQAGAAHEMIILDGDNDEGAPSTEPLVALGPLEDSDAEGETVPLEARWRRRVVYSNEERGGADGGADGDETSSQRSCPEEATGGSSQ